LSDRRRASSGEELDYGRQAARRREGRAHLAAPQKMEKVVAGDGGGVAPSAAGLPLERSGRSGLGKSGSWVPALQSTLLRQAAYGEGDGETDTYPGSRWLTD